MKRCIFYTQSVCPYIIYTPLLQSVYLPFRSTNQYAINFPPSSRPIHLITNTHIRSSTSLCHPYLPIDKTIDGICPSRGARAPHRRIAQLAEDISSMVVFLLFRLCRTKKSQSAYQHTSMHACMHTMSLREACANMREKKRGRRENRLTCCAGAACCCCGGGAACCCGWACGCGC